MKWHVNRPHTWVLMAAFGILAAATVYVDGNTKIFAQFLTLPPKGNGIVNADQLMDSRKKIGSLFVTKDVIPTPSRQCLGGEECQPVMRMNLRAYLDDIKVQSIQLSDTGASAVTEEIRLYKASGSQDLLLGIATVANCGATPVPPGTRTYCATLGQNFVIPANTEVKIIARPVIKSDNNGGLPAKKLYYYVSPTHPSAGASITVGANSVTSALQLQKNNGDNVAKGEVIIGRPDAGPNLFTVTSTLSVSVLSKIIGISNAHPATNGSAVPMGVADLGTFKFRAAPHNNTLNGMNKVVLKDIIFNVSANNVQLAADSFKFYNQSDSSTVAPCVAIQTNGTVITGTATGNFMVRCTDIPASSVQSAIDAGSNATFPLRGTVVGTSSPTYSLQVSLQNFGSMSVTGFGPSTSHLRWTDKDFASETTADFLWVESTVTTVNSVMFSN